jgi:hypothetical protein
MDYDHFTNSLVCGIENKLVFINKDTLNEEFYLYVQSKINSIIVSPKLSKIHIGLEYAIIFSFKLALLCNIVYFYFYSDSTVQVFTFEEKIQ